MKTLALAAALALSGAAPAAAAELNFTISGDADFSFALDPETTFSTASDGYAVTFYDVPFATADSGVVEFSLFSADAGGGFNLNDFFGAMNVLYTAGPQLYSGSEAMPTILLGTFDLIARDGDGRYRLTIAEAEGAVPEPATWGMMLLGFGLTGAALRRRRAPALRTA